MKREIICSHPGFVWSAPLHADHLLRHGRATVAMARALAGGSSLEVTVMARL
jgi:hypothetical protein